MSIVLTLRLHCACAGTASESEHQSASDKHSLKHTGSDELAQCAWDALEGIDEETFEEQVKLAEEQAALCRPPRSDRDQRGVC